MTCHQCHSSHSASLVLLLYCCHMSLLSLLFRNHAAITLVSVCWFLFLIFPRLNMFANYWTYSQLHVNLMLHTTPTFRLDSTFYLPFSLNRIWISVFHVIMCFLPATWVQTPNITVSPNEKSCVYTDGLIMPHRSIEWLLFFLIHFLRLLLPIIIPCAQATQKMALMLQLLRQQQLPLQPS